MRSLRNKGILLLLLCWSAVTWARPDVKFLHLDVGDGLSQGSVFAIYQDDQGLMWIGTRDGLNKYDSRKITIYRNTPDDLTTLSDNFIQSIFQDSKKRLWVGTSNGLNLYDREKDRFRQIPLSKFSLAGKPVEPSIHSILEDRSGQLWIGTNMGLFKLGMKGASAEPELIFNSIQVSIKGENRLFKEVTYLYEDEEGGFWICTNEGIVLADRMHSAPGNLRILKSFFLDGKEGSNLSPDVSCLLQKEQNLFWVGTRNKGLFALRKDQGTVEMLSLKAPKTPLGKDIRTLTRDRQGKIWIGSFNGLFCYRQGNLESYVSNDNDPNSLSNNSVRPIFQDQRGSLWIGTYFGGVNILDVDVPQFVNFIHKPHVNALSYNVVSSFQEDLQGNLWIGTEGGGLNYLDHQTQTFRYFVHDRQDTHSLSHNNVKSLCLDQSGNLWVGTYFGGLNVLKKGKQQFELFVNNPNDPRSLAHNSVYALLEDHAGNIWIGTYGGGLNVFRKQGRQAGFDVYKEEDKSLSGNFIRAIYEDSEQNIWVGTQSGLNLLRRGSDHFIFFKNDPKHPSSLSGNLVISIYEDQRKQIWIGTYKDGLNRYDAKKGAFTRINGKNGLPGNNIFGMEEDQQGNLWVSTNGGIVKLDPHTLRLRTYNNIDGLVGNEFISGAHYKRRNGDLLFGSSQGFSLFNPDSIGVNLYSPPVILTELKLFNKKVRPSDPSGVLKEDISLTQELSLTYKQHVFSLDFASLNYVLPEKNRYAYKLEGFDEDWTYVRTPSATYTNLDPGTYVFLVKGTNNDGIWSEVPRRLTIHILPPPWATRWAYLGYVLLFGGITYLVISFFRGRNALKHELLLEHLALEKQKEIHEAKLNFFTNISHEFRTPLSLIVGPIDRLAQLDQLPQQAVPLLKNAQKNADRLLQLVNQLLDFRKQEYGQVELRRHPVPIVDFMRDIMNHFLYLSAEHEVALQLETDVPEEMEIWVDAEQMEKVLTNLLHNAFKFTDAGGKVQISLRKQAPSSAFPIGSLCIEVSDSGCGIPADSLEHVFERFYQANPSYEDRLNTGWGIGLALANNIVKWHGGRLTAQSNQAQFLGDFNTHFRVELPLRDGTEATTGQPIDQREQDLYRSFSQDEGVHGLGGDRPVLLVVEDHSELRQFIVEGLQTYYQVMESDHGIGAWDLIKKRQPDLVISDVMMANGNGIELLKKIKSDKNTRHIPVILLTAKTATPYLKEALREGCDDYLTKPFSFQVLLWKIHNMLESRKRLTEKFVQEFLLKPQGEQVEKANTFLDDAIRITEQNLCKEGFGVHELAKELGQSRTVLYRKLKELTGLNLVEFIKVVRLKKAAQLLTSAQNLTVSEIAYQVGFSDPKYFARSFKGYYQVTPTEYMDLDHLET